MFEGVAEADLKNLGIKIGPARRYIYSLMLSNCHVRSDFDPFKEEHDSEIALSALLSLSSNKYEFLDDSQSDLESLWDGNNLHLANVQQVVQQADPREFIGIKALTYD